MRKPANGKSSGNSNSLHSNEGKRRADVQLYGPASKKTRRVTNGIKGVLFTRVRFVRKATERDLDDIPADGHSRCVLLLFSLVLSPNLCQCGSSGTLSEPTDVVRDVIDGVGSMGGIDIAQTQEDISDAEWVASEEEEDVSHSVVDVEGEELTTYDGDLIKYTSRFPSS